MTILATPQQQQAWNQQWQQPPQPQMSNAPPANMEEYMKQYYAAEMQWRSQQQIAETAGYSSYEEYLRGMGIVQRSGKGVGKGQAGSMASSILGKGAGKPAPIALSVSYTHLTLPTSV